MLMVRVLIPTDHKLCEQKNHQKWLNLFKSVICMICSLDRIWEDTSIQLVQGVIEKGSEISRQFFTLLQTTHQFFRTFSSVW